MVRHRGRCRGRRLLQARLAAGRADEQARSRREGSPRHHRRPGGEREELRAHRGQRLHVRRRQAGVQARDPRRRRGHLGRAGAQGQHAQPQGQDAAHPPVQPRRAGGPTPSGPSSPSPPATASSCSRAEGRTMAIRTRKPTSAGRRFQSVSDFAEITKSTPEKTLLAPRSGHRRPQLRGPQDRSPQGRRPQAPVPPRRLQADQGRRRRQGGGDRVRPQPHLPHRPAPLRGRREGLHPGAPQREGGRPPDERPGRRHPARQRAAAALHPGRHRGPQRGAAARPGRQDGPLGRLQRPAGGQGGRLRLAPPAQHRDAPGAHRLPGHRGRGRQRRARAHQDRQGRPQPLEGRRAPRPAAWP